jgi:hypothetical protein
MSKIGQKIVKALQLDHKWVRVMLTVSILAVVVIFFIPTTMKTQEIMMGEYPAPVMDTTVVMPDSSTARVIIRRQPTGIERLRPANVDRMQPAPPPPPKDTVTASEPIQVQIVEAKKPFDWKGTVTWGIGALNGLILVFLNLKNLLFKKNP